MPSPRPHQCAVGRGPVLVGMAQKQAFMGCGGYGPSPGSKCRLSLGLGWTLLNSLGFHVYKWEGSQQGKDKPMESKMY